MDIQLSKFTMKPSGNALQQTTNTIFEVVLLIIIAALFYWFIVHPKQGELATAQANVAQLTTQQQDVQKNKEDLQQLIAQLDSNKQEIQDMDEALPLDDRITRLHILFETLAQSSGLTVTSLGITGDDSGTIAGDKTLLANPYQGTRALQKIQASMALTGSYTQMQDFLQKLATSGRIIDVTSISIHNSKDSTLIFNINLNTYYYGLQQAQ